MKIQPIVEHEPPHKGVEGEAQAAEEVRDKHNTLIGLRCRDNLPWSRKPVLDIGDQVSDLPKLCNVLLLDQGSHSLALSIGSGHIGGSGVLELRSRVLELEVIELEVREGAREVEKRHRPRPLYKGGEYQESSAQPLETYPKVHGVIPTVVVGSHTPILMKDPVIRGTRSLL